MKNLTDFVQRKNLNKYFISQRYTLKVNNKTSRTLLFNYFVRRAKEKYGNRFDYSLTTPENYHGQRYKIKIICPIHGVFEQTPAVHLMIQNGCGKCGWDKQHQDQSLSTMEFIKKAKTIHGDMYNYDKVNYINHYTDVILICNKHGEFHIHPGDHMYHSHGCPICKSSHGEQIITRFLETHDVKYERQKKFDKLVSGSRKQPLKFDFYLPKLNILIEFDGIHHEKPTRFNGISNEKATINHLLTKKNDILKNDYASLHKIRLIRIPYAKTKEIEKILNKELSTRQEDR